MLFIVFIVFVVFIEFCYLVFCVWCFALGFKRLAPNSLQPKILQPMVYALQPLHHPRTCG
jgi:hypothetical protein